MINYFRMSELTFFVFVGGHNPKLNIIPQNLHVEQANNR